MVERPERRSAKPNKPPRPNRACAVCALHHQLAELNPLLAVAAPWRHASMGVVGPDRSLQSRPSDRLR